MLVLHKRSYVYYMAAWANSFMIDDDANPTSYYQGFKLFSIKKEETEGKRRYSERKRERERERAFSGF